MPLSTFRVDTGGMIELAVKAISERCGGSGKPFGRTVVGGQPVYRESEIPIGEEQQTEEKTDDGGYRKNAEG